MRNGIAGSSNELEQEPDDGVSICAPATDAGASKGTIRCPLLCHRLKCASNFRQISQVRGYECRLQASCEVTRGLFRGC
jgi:hypothetical protein